MPCRLRACTGPGSGWIQRWCVCPLCRAATRAWRMATSQGAAFAVRSQRELSACWPGLAHLLSKACIRTVINEAACLHKLWLLCRAIERVPKCAREQAWCWKRSGWATCQMRQHMAGCLGCSSRRSRGSRCDGHYDLVRLKPELEHAAGRTSLQRA